MEKRQMAQTIEATGVRPTSAAASARPSVFTRWAILLLLAVGVMIAFSDRASTGSALAHHPFVQHFKLTSVDRGWVNSVFFWSYGLMQMATGWLVDRYGVKWPYAVIFALWCLAMAAIGLVDSLSALLVMRLIVGAAEAVVMPASYRWIRHNFAEGESGTAVGIFTMGNKFGPALGALAAPWLIVNYGWQMMFLATGVIGLVWVALWSLSVRSDLPSVEARAAMRKQASAVTFGSILRSPVVWGAMIINFSYGYFTFFCMQWMPDYLHNERHMSLKSSGLYTFFSFAGIAIVAVLAGWAADRIIVRGHDPVVVRKGFVIAGFLGACTVLLGVHAQSLNVALFWNIFSLSFLGLTTANSLALCRLTLIPKEAVGLVTGVQQVATSLAGGVAGALTGWLLQISNNNYNLPMLVIFVFLLIGAASTWILCRREWAPKVPGAADGAR
jgi:MFS transporter, ACS family, D-galactonate transporter